MAASYRPFRLEITGTLMASSFHTGTGEYLSVISDAPILRDTANQPYLPGSSLRGAIRAHLERDGASLPGSFDELFGMAGNKAAQLGRLTICDARPVQAFSTGVRDHVRLDRKTAAAASGAKFDRETAENGSFAFRAVYEGDSAKDPELGLVEEAVRALIAGEIRFGAHAGRGQGCFALSAVEYRSFPRDEVAGLARWLEYRLTGACPPTGFVHRRDLVPSGKSQHDLKPWNWIEWDLELICDGPVLVRSGLPATGRDTGFDAFNPAGYAQKGAISADAHFVTRCDGKPYLPGSSLRGLLRSHAEWIERTKNNGEQTPLCDVLFGAAAGDSGMRGRLDAGDASLTSDLREMYFDHVAIDRVLGFAADAKKFSTQALISPRFRTRLRLRVDDEEWDLVRLLGFVLRDLNDGWLWCGSGVTRGYGHIRGMKIHDVKLNLTAATWQAIGAAWPDRKALAGRAMASTGRVEWADLSPLWREP